MHGAVSDTYEGDTKSRRLIVYMSPNLARAVDALAAIDRRDVSKWIRLLVEDEVRDRSGEIEDAA